MIIGSIPFRPQVQQYASPPVQATVAPMNYAQPPSPYAPNPYAAQAYYPQNPYGANAQYPQPQNPYGVQPQYPQSPYGIQPQYPSNPYSQQQQQPNMSQGYYSSPQQGGEKKNDGNELGFGNLSTPLLSSEQSSQNPAPDKKQEFKNSYMRKFES